VPAGEGKWQRIGGAEYLDVLTHPRRSWQDPQVPRRESSPGGRVLGGLLQVECRL